MALLIREAILPGISTRHAGRIVATFTGEPVSAQTVSILKRELDAAVRRFHQVRLKNERAYLLLDGLSLRAAAGGTPTGAEAGGLRHAPAAGVQRCWMALPATL